VPGNEIVQVTIITTTSLISDLACGSPAIAGVAVADEQNVTLQRASLDLAMGYKQLLP